VASFYSTIQDIEMLGDRMPSWNSSPKAGKQAEETRKRKWEL
jgi:hypothetical protein